MSVNVPVFPFPEKSVALVEVPSLKDQYPTSPRLLGGFASCLRIDVVKLVMLP